MYYANRGKFCVPSISIKKLRTDKSGYLVVYLMQPRVAIQQSRKLKSKKGVIHCELCARLPSF